MRFVLGLLMLLLAAAVASAASRPSPSNCAVAWNEWAPLRLHEVVAKNRARAAFVDARSSVGTDTWSKSGRTTSTASAGCTIDFVLPGSRGVLVAWGAWRSGTIRVWHQPLMSGRPVPVPHNARVRSDGTVGFTG